MVVGGLRCNAGLRFLSGFLVMYMAFLLREHPFEGWEDRNTLLLVPGGGRRRARQHRRRRVGVAC